MVLYLANDERNFSCASRATLASSSSYRLQLYHDEPCGSQEPKHTQQNSCLQFWFLHTCEFEKTTTIKTAYQMKRSTFLEFTHHMITSAIFFNGHITFWTFFRVSGNPIRCF